MNWLRRGTSTRWLAEIWGKIVLKARRVYYKAIGKEYKPRKTKLYETKITLKWAGKKLVDFPLTIAAQSKLLAAKAIEKEIKIEHGRILTGQVLSKGRRPNMKKVKKG